MCRFPTLVVLLLSAAFLIGCGRQNTSSTNPTVTILSDGTSVSNRNLVQTAQSLGLTTFVSAVQAAGLSPTLQSVGTYTVFAPTNNAFALFGQDLLNQLLQPSNQAKLRQLMNYHIIPGFYPSSNLFGFRQLTTFQGQVVSFSSFGNQIFINNSLLIQRDIRTANGIIHVIDRVLIPNGVL